MKLGWCSVETSGDRAPRTPGATSAHFGSSEVGERLALALNQAGMQRMVARVLAAFLFSDRQSVTAGELAEQLDASAGSISAAIKMLRTVALIEPAPAPGSRRDHYRMSEDAWATLMSSQNAMIGMMQNIAEDGLATVTDDGPASARLRQMHSFYTHLLTELPALIDRWHQSQDTGHPPQFRP